MNFPRDATSRLTLEPLTADHADELSGLLDPRVNAHFTPDCVPADLDDLRVRFARMVAYDPPDGRFLNFAIRLRSGTCIGRLEASIRGDHAELAFLLVPEAWGHGYAAEAVRLLEALVTARHGVRRFWLCIHPSNAPSLRLARRLGYAPAPADTWPGLGSYDEGDVVLTATRGGGAEGG